MKLGMKEPAKETDNQVFHYLDWCQEDDDSNSIDTPLHRSTPKDKKEPKFSFSSCRSAQLEHYFQTALARGNEQLGTIQNAYEGLVVAWRHEDEMSDADKTLVRQSTPSGMWELEQRLSARSSQSTTLSEGCLDNCEIPEPVLDLFKELAKQLLRCQSEIVSLKEENMMLKQQKGDDINEFIKHRVADLTSEIDLWKESCNESRKEIEILKMSLSNHKEQIKKLQIEKKQMTSRLKTNHGSLEKEKQLEAHSHISQSLNALKRLSDQQQQLINHLQESLQTGGALSSSAKLNVSSSSGHSTLPPSLNVSSGSIKLLAKKLSDPSKRTEMVPLKYDESLMKLSRCMMNSNEMLRQVERKSSISDAQDRLHININSN